MTHTLNLLQTAESIVVVVVQTLLVTQTLTLLQTTASIAVVVVQTFAAEAGTIIHTLRVQVTLLGPLSAGLHPQGGLKYHN